MQTSDMQNLRLIIPTTDISLNQPKHPIFQACGGTHAVVQDADSLPEAPVRASRGGGHPIPLAGIPSGLSTVLPSGAQCETGVSSYLSNPVVATPDNQVSCGSMEGHAIGPMDAGTGNPALRSGYQAPPAGIHFVKRFSSSSGLKSRNPKNSLNFFSNSGVSWRSLLFGRIATYWAELMRRTLAPLRKIVARELEVFEFRRNSVHPQSFAVHDRLECGHVHTSLLWDIFDLLFAYTESSHVRAIRHRCVECLTLTQRKPMASVTAVAKAA